MKRILVPIDFSDACENALNYAVEFALKARQQICLLNVYNLPLTPGITSVPIPSTGDMIAEHLKKLERIRTRILKRHETLHIACYCEPGTVIETINAFVQDNDIDLIIMGMQGGGYISEKIIGSTTTSLMCKATCPVLGIAKRVKYKPIKRIGLASDYENAAYVKLLKPLRELTKLFDAHLFLFHVEEPEMAGHERLVPGARLTHALEEIPYTVHSTRHEKVAEGIEEFVKDQAIDMVAVIPRRHSFFESIFREPNTRRLAFHTHIPLLALHYD